MSFLLTVPFAQRFAQVTPFQERIYFATLLLTAIAAALLISPSAYHRMVFRTQQKDHLIFTANRLMIAGLAFLALAMTGAVLLITDVLFNPTATALTGGAAFALYAVLCYALPLHRRIKGSH